jgi:hypothetical protein
MLARIGAATLAFVACFYALAPALGDAIGIAGVMLLLYGCLIIGSLIRYPLIIARDAVAPGSGAAGAMS